MSTNLSKEGHQPVMAEAVAIHGDSHPSAPTAPTVVHVEQQVQQPVGGVVQATYVEPQLDNVGICRRCRRQFTRPPGINDGQAQYYRCADCEEFRLSDLIAGSCSVC